MKIEDILAGVPAALGIGGLNAMQMAMAADNSRRVMLTAPTGSGKTVAFAVKLLREIMGNFQWSMVNGVVVAPTRELVLQVAGVLRRMFTGQCSPANCGVVALYGGHDFRTEVNELGAGTASVVVATPGRLVDHINRHTVDISRARCLVIDEFDKCLQLGFQDEMEKIAKRMRGLRTTVLTSATAGVELPAFVGDAADYRRYDYGEGETAPEGDVEVVEVDSPSRDKLDTLTALLRSVDNGRVIVFANHRESAERIFEHLMREGVPAVLYHGALDQQQRRMAVERLANGSAPVMVATDLAARGLDIPELDAVVHYHMPLDAETWTHRNGRTGRQGASGRVYAILSEGERLPEGVEADRKLTVLTPSADPITADMATLYINAGKKEKISKGDVAGYVMKQGGLDRGEVGRIMVDDHYAMVAVAAAKAREVAAKLAGIKLKGQRVKVSMV